MVKGIRLLRRILAITWMVLVATVVTWPCPHAQNQTDHAASVPKATEVCPDTIPSVGKYENFSYGFSVIIPDSLRGYWNGPRCVGGPGGCTCMTDHGRIIPLNESSQGERHVEIFAGYAVPDKPTVTGEVHSRLRWIKERSREGIVDVTKRTHVTVAGLRGQRAVVRYFDKTSKLWFIEDFIELLKDGVSYSLYLRTPETEYKHDRPIFDQIVATFVLTKPTEQN
jgi:hypothetical protein